MKTEKQKKEISAIASASFGNGYHCAEAVVVSVLDSMNDCIQPAIAHATAFGGGFGRSFEEACGALSGALIVIGHIYGRKVAGENWDLPANLGAEMRDIFIKNYGTTHCKSLRDRFGEDQQMEECRKLTAKVAEEVFGLLEKSRNSTAA